MTRRLLRPLKIDSMQDFMPYSPGERGVRGVGTGNGALLWSHTSCILSVQTSPQSPTNFPAHTSSLLTGSSGARFSTPESAISTANSIDI